MTDNTNWKFPVCQIDHLSEQEFEIMVDMAKMRLDAAITGGWHFKNRSWQLLGWNIAIFLALLVKAGNITQSPIFWILSALMILAITMIVLIMQYNSKSFVYGIEPKRIAAMRKALPENEKPLSLRYYQAAFLENLQKSMATQFTKNHNQSKMLNYGFILSGMNAACLFMAVIMPLI